MFANSTYSEFGTCTLRLYDAHIKELGPVVQSIVSLTTLLRRHLVKYMPTNLSNTLLFFVEKMRESYAVQKILTFFQQKITVYL